MKLKWLYLFLAFFFPLSVVFVLQFYGKSEFDIPVYYEKGISSDSLTDCRFNYTAAPYSIPDSILNRFTAEQGKIMVATIDSSEITLKNFERIQEELSPLGFTFVKLKQEEARWMPCFLFLKEPWTTVLIDDRARIRGYYTPATRRETDRLAAELKILLKDY